MSKENAKDLIIGLIEVGSIADESINIIKKNLSIIRSAKFEGAVVKGIEVDRAFSIYKKRVDILKASGKNVLGYDELLAALKSSEGLVKPLLMSSETSNVTIFLNEDMNFIVGAIIIEK
ncbi:MAG: hypothetical protein V4660_09915 [Pseudomonadota bacterium]